MGTTNKDKRRRKAIHNDLEDIDDVIKTMKNTIDDLDWNNPEAYNDIAGDVEVLQNKLKDLAENTHAEPLAELAKVVRSVNALDHAHERQDQKAALQETQKLKKRMDMLESAIATIDDQFLEDGQKEKLEHILEAVKQDVDEIVESAKNIASDLRTNKIKDHLGDLEVELLNTIESADPTDSPLKGDAEELNVSPKVFIGF